MGSEKTQADHTEEVGPFLFENYCKVVAENAELRAELGRMAELLAKAPALLRHAGPDDDWDTIPGVPFNRAQHMIAKWLPKPKQEAADD